MQIISIIISVLLVTTAIFSIYHIVVLFSNINEPEINGESSSGSGIFACKENVTQNSPCFGLVMITRNEWVAQPALNPIDRIELPARNIILTDTKTEECMKIPNCIKIVRTLQDDHVLFNDDIAYNFLVSSQGDIYQGRGWLLKSAEASEDLMKTSYWIGLIGNFSENPVREMQFKAVQHFILHAKSIGKLISTPDIHISGDILVINNFTDSFLNATTK